ncbi:hypothetical protein BDZ45DRAFT_740261 [Acephala macrosclerotiorum]|nr:hypothetical protein BDZ45DRAFT_740261 [Acephala macrosclerotiorum]
MLLENISEEASRDDSRMVEGSGVMEELGALLEMPLTDGIVLLDEKPKVIEDPWTNAETKTLTEPEKLAELEALRLLDLGRLVDISSIKEEVGTRSELETLLELELRALLVVDVNLEEEGDRFSKLDTVLELEVRMTPVLDVVTPADVVGKDVELKTLLDVEKPTIVDVVDLEEDKLKTDSELETIFELELLLEFKLLAIVEVFSAEEVVEADSELKMLLKLELFEIITPPTVDVLTPEEVVGIEDAVGELVDTEDVVGPGDKVDDDVRIEDVVRPGDEAGTDEDVDMNKELDGLVELEMVLTDDLTSPEEVVRMGEGDVGIGEEVVSFLLLLLEVMVELEVLTGATLDEVDSLVDVEVAGTAGGVWR